MRKYAMNKKQVFILFLILAACTLLSLSTEEKASTYTHSDPVKINKHASTSAYNPPTFDPNNVISYLPAAWCGTETNVDNHVNAFNDNNPKIKIMYVHAADQPDNFLQLANILQTAVSQDRTYLITQSNGTKTLDVDLGTACGPQYVDIQSITLPHKLSYYKPSLATISTNIIFSDLAKYSSKTYPFRHYLYYVDQMNPVMNMWGEAQVIDNESTDIKYNSSNDGGHDALILGPQGTIEENERILYGLPDLMLHELTHTMGGVSLDAPNATGGYHCTDGRDLMCYNDGGPTGSKYNETSCPELVGESPYSTYDCNKDDYFNSNPAPGSYLATHWNVYNSIYLTTCLNIATPCSRGQLLSHGVQTKRNRIYKYTKNKKKRRKVNTKKYVTIKTTPNSSNNSFNIKINSQKISLPKGRYRVAVCLVKTDKNSTRKYLYDKECLTKKVTINRAQKFKPQSLFLNQIAANTYGYGQLTIRSVKKDKTKPFFNSSDLLGNKVVALF